jgi:integrase
VVGIVTEIAAGVTACAVGDRVLAILDWGGFAEEVCVTEHTVYRLPALIDSTHALHAGISYGTAYGALVWRGKLNAGENVLSAKAQRYTIGQAIADYLAYGDIEAKGKRYTLNKLAEEFNELAVKNLTPEILKKWKDKKLNTSISSHPNKIKKHYLFDGDRERKYSPGTVRKMYYSLKTCLDWHSNFRKYPFQSPFLIVKAPVEDNARDRRLEGDEEERLLSACDKLYSEKEVFKNVIRFALETAMRRGEIFKLKWADINFQSRTIRIKAENSKTDTERVVPITSTCLDVLNAQQGTKDTKNPLVFWQLNPNTFNHRFKGIMRNAKVEGFSFHCFRHEATSRFFEKSQLNDVEIALIVGHSDLRTLKRYTHSRPTSLLERLW